MDSLWTMPEGLIEMCDGVSPGGGDNNELPVDNPWKTSGRIGDNFSAARVVVEDEGSYHRVIHRPSTFDQSR